MLAGAAVFFIILMYAGALKKTMTLYSDLKENRQKIEKLTEAPLKIAILRKRLKCIEERIGIDNEEDTFEQEIINLLSRYCRSHGIQFTEMPSAIVVDESEYKVKTGIFICEGQFIELTRMLSFIESQAAKGHLCAVSYFTQKDNNLTSPVLKLCLYYQNYSKIGM